MSFTSFARAALPFGVVAALLAPAAAQTLVTIDPSPFIDGTDISNAFPGAVLSAQGSDPVSGAVIKRTATTGLAVPTAVLGHDGSFPEFWFDLSGSVGTAILRIDFPDPADVVSIDFLMNNGSDPTILQAFNSSDVLLATATTPGTSGAGSIETATIDRGGLFDVAYVLATAQSGDDVYIQGGNATVLAPECFLLVGLTATAVPIPWGDGTDALYLVPLALFPVALDDIPVFPIPNDPALEGIHVYGQVYMSNAIDFPGDPIKVSNAVDAVLNGGQTAYGTATGMQLWLNQPPVLGGVLEFAFSIDGF